ncbi:Assembly protein [Mesorhizobium loti]|nr:Assembly protein [Mesorhizobium loti]
MGLPKSESRSAHIHADLFGCGEVVDAGQNCYSIRHRGLNEAIYARFARAASLLKLPTLDLIHLQGKFGRGEDAFPEEDVGESNDPAVIVA